MKLLQILNSLMFVTNIHFLFILVLCATLPSTMSVAMEKEKYGTANENIELKLEEKGKLFVDELREKLRVNNDDYKETAVSRSIRVPLHSIYNPYLQSKTFTSNRLTTAAIFETINTEGSWEDKHSTIINDSEELEDTALTPKVKYKIIEVKEKHPSRRSGSHSRFLIQAEGAEGVSLMQLGDGPIPPLVLPPSRRQYMAHLDDLPSDGTDIQRPDSYEINES